MNYPRNILKPVLDYFKKMEIDLLRRKTSLDKEDPFADATRLNDNASDDTEAAEQYGHAQSETLSQETNEILQRVRSSMDRINKGTYGKCESCGEMIDTDRLSIDPTASKCMKCVNNVK